MKKQLTMLSSLFVCKRLPALSIISVLLLNLSCTKKVGYVAPEAGFSIDKQNYAAGDKIIINNTSKHTDECRWTLIGPTGEIIHNAPEGSPLADWNEWQPTLKLSIFAKDGLYTLHQKASNTTAVVSEMTIKFTVATEYGFVRAKLAVPVKWSSSFSIDGENVKVIGENLTGTYFPPVTFITKVPVGQRLCSYYIYSSSTKKILNVVKDETTEF